MLHNKHINARAYIMHSTRAQGPMVFYLFWRHRNGIVKACAICLKIDVPLLCCPRKPLSPCRLTTTTILAAPRPDPYLFSSQVFLCHMIWVNFCHLYGYMSFSFREGASFINFKASESTYIHSPDIILWNNTVQTPKSLSLNNFCDSSSGPVDCTLQSRRTSQFLWWK